MSFLVSKHSLQSVALTIGLLAAILVTLSAAEAAVVPHERESTVFSGSPLGDVRQEHEDGLQEMVEAGPIEESAESRPKPDDVSVAGPGNADTLDANAVRLAIPNMTNGALLMLVRIDSAKWLRWVQLELERRGEPLRYVQLAGDEEVIDGWFLDPTIVSQMTIERLLDEAMLRENRFSDLQRRIGECLKSDNVSVVLLHLNRRLRGAPGFIARIPAASARQYTEALSTWIETHRPAVIRPRDNHSGTVSALHTLGLVGSSGYHDQLWKSWREHDRPLDSAELLVPLTRSAHPGARPPR